MNKQIRIPKGNNWLFFPNCFEFRMPKPFLLRIVLGTVGLVFVLSFSSAVAEDAFVSQRPLPREESFSE